MISAVAMSGKPTPSERTHRTLAADPTIDVCSATRRRPIVKPIAKRNGLVLPIAVPTSLRRRPSQRTNTAVKAQVPRLVTAPMSNPGGSPANRRSTGAIEASRTAHATKKSKTRPKTRHRGIPFSTVPKLSDSQTSEACRARHELPDNGGCANHRASIVEAAEARGLKVISPHHLIRASHDEILSSNPSNPPCNRLELSTLRFRANLQGRAVQHRG